MEGCREVKGQEEDEHCGAREISQPTKFHRLRKFANLEIFTLIQKILASTAPAK